MHPEKTPSKDKKECAPASPHRRALDTSLHLSNLAGCLIAGDNEELAKELKILDEKEKKVMVSLAEEKLKKEPTNLEDNLRWLAYLQILHILDPSKVPDIEKKTLDKTIQCLIILRQFKSDQTDKLQAVQQKLIDLHRLINLQNSQEGETRCILLFSEWENDIMNNEGDKVLPYIDHQIDAEIQKVNSFAPGMQATLRKMLIETKKDKKFAKLQSKIIIKPGKNGEIFYVSKDQNGKNRTWQLAIENDFFLAFRSTNPQEKGLIFATGGIDLLTDPTVVDKKLQEAIADYDSEKTQAHRDALDRYDIPKDKNIAHIKIFPKENDPMVSKGLLDSMLLSGTLKATYGKKLLVMPAIFSDNPVSELKATIAGALKENHSDGMHFIIDIFSHGREDFLVFGNRVEAKDLIQIVKDFPQCTFTFNTVACFGGGLMKGFAESEEFKKDPKLKERVALFTQTKGTRPNSSTVVEGMTVYYYHLMKGLKQGLTYGAAARRADEEVERTTPNNPEAWIEGRKYAHNQPESQPQTNPNVAT